MWSEPVLIVRSVYLSIRCQRYMRSTCQPHSHTSSSMTSSEVCDLVGGDSLKDPPVPIPNTEVKLQGADGTAGETRWESRSPPATPSSLRGTPPVELCSRGRFLLWTAALGPGGAAPRQAHDRTIVDWCAAAGCSPRHAAAHAPWNRTTPASPTSRCERTTTGPVPRPFAFVADRRGVTPERRRGLVSMVHAWDIASMSSTRQYPVLCVKYAQLGGCSCSLSWSWSSPSSIRSPVPLLTLVRTVSASPHGVFWSLPKSSMCTSRLAL